MRVVCPHCLAVNNIPQKQSYKKANCGACKKSLLDTKPIELKASNFDEVIVNSQIPVIVDFWAPWCAPCKMIAPVFLDLAQLYPLKVLFAKVNTEQEQILASRMNIRGIPTIIAYKDGKIANQVSGALPYQQLKDFVQALLD
jgi:thioredoxin 2